MSRELSPALLNILWRKVKTFYSNSYWRWWIYTEIRKWDVIMVHLLFKPSDTSIIYFSNLFEAIWEFDVRCNRLMTPPHVSYRIFDRKNNRHSVKEGDWWSERHKPKEGPSWLNFTNYSSVANTRVQFFIFHPSSFVVGASYFDPRFSILEPWLRIWLCL